MDELWAECEREGWKDLGAVRRLVSLLRLTGQHERAEQAKRNYEMTNGPPCGEVSPYPDMPLDEIQRHIDIIQRMSNRWGYPSDAE
ncbi:hypothetical protein GobsT_17860 [Gemmata obscuriglobus]|uniref:Uncharacterized protein n=1 Tax=Gemmata obscuriglobus TaxID=114 RepID=A0A2Z3HDR7_9BACT|nr:hypothetical protein [Gemmata obscuriglobus]AWM39844.1 hypothetical protein C1280_24435 [Gemmata obscuriglobus]QEG27033.1 hypothetical protein GobsT_17860 [Gemmata obscuriglobus]VTS03392.1 unnamed protein product [Gemmata obscuriglobus UQM 2246]